MVGSVLGSDAEGKPEEYHRLGDHYTARFLKGHPEFTTTVACTTDCNRVLALNKESLKTYFDNLERCISRNKILPEDMWNFDEKGFRMGLGGKKNELVIARVRVNRHGEHRMAIESG